MNDDRGNAALLAGLVDPFDSLERQRAAFGQNRSKTRRAGRFLNGLSQIPLVTNTDHNQPFRQGWQMWTIKAAMLARRLI
ncbi:MAG: hypothetical protein AAGH60_02920 [Pseudomonadota bacterium]